MADKIAIICVNLTKRDDVYFASSDDLPGLFVVGRSLEAVRADVAPMIEKIYLVSQNRRVTALPAADPRSFEIPAWQDAKAVCFVARRADPLAA